jgi:hypothetical protein
VLFSFQPKFSVCCVLRVGGFLFSLQRPLVAIFCILVGRFQHARLMSAPSVLGQKQTCGALAHVCFGPRATHAPQQIDSLFDHLVRPREECRRHGKAERLGRFEIDYELIFSQRLYGQVDRLFALENAVATVMVSVLFGGSVIVAT